MSEQDWKPSQNSDQHYEALIAAFQNSRIAVVWYELKHGIRSSCAPASFQRELEGERNLASADPNP
jgi:hypothetical protein